MDQDFVCFFFGGSLVYILCLPCQLLCYILVVSITFRPNGLNPNEKCSLRQWVELSTSAIYTISMWIFSAYQLLFCAVQIYSSWSEYRGWHLNCWSSCWCCPVFFNVCCWTIALIKSRCCRRFSAGSKHVVSRFFASWTHHQSYAWLCVCPLLPSPYWTENIVDMQHKKKLSFSNGYDAPLEWSNKCQVMCHLLLLW